jgi:internalin A
MKSAQYSNRDLHNNSFEHLQVHAIVTMSKQAPYISYAWGDDGTPEGREREAIVDDLCSSFAEVGIEIGRDKNEIKPGDSIEKFGVRIAKASLILAVISARSLRSEWCMLYELYEAYTRRGSNGNEFTEDVVALVLDDAESDLNKNKSLIDYWSAKCIEYQEMLDIADPSAERSLESRKVLGKYREMIKSLPDMLLAIRRIAMPRGSAAIRSDDFKEIREYVQNKLCGAKDSEPFTPLSQRLGALSIKQPVPSATTPAPLRTACDAVALILSPSGEEKEAERCYQWGAFIQKAGEDQFQQIPNGAIGAEPTYPKSSLEELLQCLQCWIDSELADEPVLEIYAPDILLDEDWGSISTQAGEEPKPLHSYQPFLLRSSDRLLNRQWNKRRGALKRMHHLLVEGTGAWLPQDQLTKTSNLETLDGETQDKYAGDAVITAICLLQPNMLEHKLTWLRSVLKSMAPLVVWPSQQSTLGEDQIQLCLRYLSLIRDDTNKDNKVERPHCPDLVRLAKARQKWNHPDVDLRDLTILVDHPDRAPDRTMLQALFSPARPDPSSAPPGERPGPQPSLLISS